MARRRAEDDQAEALGRLLAVAVVAAYIELHPNHDAGPLLAACPELKAQADRYYEAAARHLLRAGVRPPGEPG
jgi:hypothetical protein